MKYLMREVDTLAHWDICFVITIEIRALNVSSYIFSDKRPFLFGFKIAHRIFLDLE